MSSAPRTASIRTGRPALAWPPAAVSAQASSSGVLTRNPTADVAAPMAAGSAVQSQEGISWYPAPGQPMARSIV